MLERAVKKSTIINAFPAEVWKKLTDPESIRKFLFDATVKTDWKAGHSIEFTGNWKGRDYQGKGEILKIEKEKKLEHTYYSNLSSLPDAPENYCHIIYELEEKDNQTVVSITQTDIDSQDEFDQVSEYWQIVIEKLKVLVEKEVTNQVTG